MKETKALLQISFIFCLIMIFASSLVMVWLKSEGAAIVAAVSVVFAVCAVAGHYECEKDAYNDEEDDED